MTEGHYNKKAQKKKKNIIRRHHHLKVNKSVIMQCELLNWLKNILVTVSLLLPIFDTSIAAQQVISTILPSQRGDQAALILGIGCRISPAEARHQEGRGGGSQYTPFYNEVKNIMQGTDWYIKVNTGSWFINFYNEVTLTRNYLLYVLEQGHILGISWVSSWLILQWDVTLYAKILLDMGSKKH